MKKFERFVRYIVLISMLTSMLAGPGFTPASVVKAEAPAQEIIPPEPAGDEPTPEPTPVPTEIPVEIPTEVPPEAPTEVPPEIPTEVPTEVPPVEVPTETPVEIPTEMPTSLPTELPTEIPTATPTGMIETPTATPTIDLTPTLGTTTPTLSPTPTLTPTPDQDVFYVLEQSVLPDGSPVEIMSIIGPRHPPAGFEEARQAVQPPIEANTEEASSLSVPAYQWVFGCSAVSAAMIAAYYDNNGFPNMYTGPSNGGVMPMTDAMWSWWSDGYDTYPNNPLIASHNGLDGRTSRGSIDDYWIQYGSSTSDPYITGGWTQHTWGSSVGDYMWTSQSAYSNSDGSTKFWNYTSSSNKLTCDALGSNPDGTVGRRNYYLAKGYTVTECYNQKTDNQISGGFSFANYKSEIQAGHPVLLNLIGHSIVGVGYADPSTVYIHDTWDNSTHSMTWGGSYSGMTLNSVSIVNLQSTVPGVPVLVSPAASASLNSVRPTFTWNAASNASTYHIQVSQSPNFTSNAVDTTISDTTYTPDSDISGDGLWYWRVAGVSETGTYGTWAASRSYTLDTTPPAAPILSSPADAATPVGIPAFGWGAVTGANAYQFRLDDDSGYGSPLVITPDGDSVPGTPLTAVSYTPTGLVYGTVYYWSVRARDAAGNWGDFSASRTMNVQASLPAAPVLKTPATGSVTNVQPDLTWNSVSTASTYQIQIDNASTFTDPIFEDQSGIGGLSHTVSTPLTDATWYWRVRATNATGGVGAWSTAWSFTFDTLPPAAPTLTSPAAEAIVRSTPMFSWGVPATATAYEFEYGTTTDGTIATFVSVYNSGTLSLYYHTPPTMSLGGYYWHVRARDAAGNWGDWSALRKINVYAPILAAPTSFSPATGFLTNNTLLTFSWGAVANAKSYLLQFADTANFSSSDPDTHLITLDPGLTSYEVVDPNLFRDGIWYWRVATVNATDEAGSYSTAISFTIDTAPPSAPTLSAPADGATPVGTPAFTWSIPTGANAYQFQLDDDSGFGSPYITTPDGSAVPGTPLSIATYTPAGLTLGTVYYWHVKARDAAGNWGDWSTAFSMNPQAALPTAPVLTSPAYSALTNDTTPTFTWNAATNGVNYQLQIDNLYSFASPEIDIPNTGGLTYTLAGGAEALSVDGLYYWHVRAQNITGGWGPWSTATPFTLDTTPPAAPTLTAPADGATPVGIPAFTWSIPTGANAYQFQMDDDNAFGSPLITTPDGSSSYPGTPLALYTYTPTGLTLGTVYYWHVKARDAAGNWSDWSSSFSMNPQATLPTAPVLTSPAYAALTNDTTPTFTWNAATNGVNYQLQIDNLYSFASPEIDIPNTGGLTYTLAGGAEALSVDGLYYWHVRAQNITGGWGPWSTATPFTLDTTPPAVPVLSSPPDGSNTLRVVPTFMWGYTAGANAYQFQIATDTGYTTDLYSTPDGSSVPGTPITLTSARPDALNVLTTYYWHVRARDAAGNWSDWSADRTFTRLPALPTAPVQTAPAISALTNDTTPTFTWNAVADAIGYRLQIDNVVSFASPEVDVADTGGLTYTLSGAETLALDGVWYWRVQGFNAVPEGGAWSTTRSFTLDTTPPAAPTLTSPVDGATPVGTPAFTWGITAGANAYQYQIDDDLAFGSPLITTPDGDAYPGTPLATTTYTPTGLTLGTVYYWHVKARDAAGNWGDWSIAFSMNPQATLPTAPVLTSPAFAALTNDTTPTFTWNAATNGVVYQLQIDNLSTFASPEVDVPDTGGLTYTLSVAETLTIDGLYYWRVRAQNITGGWGPWAAARSFTLDTTPPVVPSLTYPVDGATPVGIPAFTWGLTATANAYQYQIDDDPAFGSPLITTPDGDGNPGTPLATTTYTPTGLTLGTVYYWHVKARDAAGNWGDWSTAFAVNVQATLPAAPVLTSPAYAALINDTTPTFTWNAATNGVVYQLQIDNLYTFASPEVDVPDTGGLTYTLSAGEALSTDGLFYWRVRAQNITGGWGPWAASRTFTLDTTPPAAPALTSPTDGATPVGIPNFLWGYTAGANAYQFEIADNASFTSPLVTTPDGGAFPGTPLTLTSYKPAGLVNGTIYYWHVKGRDAAGNWGDWSAPFTVNVQASLPATPVLTAPAYGALTNNNPAMVFTWGAAATASTYEIQIDNLYSFASPEVDVPDTGGLSYTLSAPLPDGLYYWRVRAQNATGGWGLWAASRTFTLDTTPPAAPALTSPTDGATPVGIPNFLWGYTAGANAYQFEIADNASFTSPLVTTPDGGAFPGTPLTLTSYKPAGLVNGTIYYWHVKGRDAAGNWGDWSAPFTVNVQASLPATPVLTAPAYGALTNNNPAMVFTWGAAATASTYEIQIDNLYSFASPEVDVPDTGGLTYTLSAPLSDGLYYWRVRAQNATGGWGLWSASRTFTLDTSAPAAPVLSSPLDGSNTLRVVPTFIWGYTAGANAYQFQIATDTGYTTDLYSTPDGSSVPGTPITLTSARPDALNVLTTYYWHVRARDAAGNWGDWSADRTFTRLPALPTAPVPTAPAYGALTNNTASIFTWNASADAATYHVQVDNLYTFASPEVDVPDTSGALTYTLDVPLLDGLYYWRVQGINAVPEGGAWSAPRTFTLDTTPPAAPALTSPTDGTTPVGIPTFLWGYTAGANAYQFEIADNASFTSPLVTTPDGGAFPGTPLTLTSYKPAGLVNGTIYYWHVKGRDAAGNWGDWSAPFTVNVQASLPATPVLTAPAYGALTNNNPAMVFTWGAAATASTYEIQIDNLYSFASPEVDVPDTGGLSYTLSAPLSDGLYYWRVRAQNATGGWGFWSASRTFTLDTSAPAAPVLSAPANGATPVGVPAFTWSIPTGANAYQFQMDDDNAFGSPLITTPDGSSSYPGTPLALYTYTPTGLTLGTVYYWHVKARDAAGNWGDWSTTFSMNPQATLPYAPVLTSPAYAALTNDTTPTFIWNAAANGVVYQLQIDNLYTFASPEIDIPDTGGLTYTLAGGAEALSTDGLYYWRVRAQNITGGWGPWSTAIPFTLDTSAPAAPVLSSPPDGSNTLRVVPTFMWGYTAGANAYQFQIATDTGYTTDLYSTPDGSSVPGTPITLTSARPDALNVLTTYYWHVRARDAAGNWGDWSADRTFTRLPALPTAPVPTAPAYGALTNNTASIFTWNASADAATYHVQVDNLYTFASPEVDVPDTSGALTYTLDVPLLDGLYYWRVQGINAVPEGGAWSAPRTFTLDTTAPAAPTLTSPANGATPVGTPAFTWSIPTGANAYQFQIDDDFEFGSPLITTPDGDAFPGTPLASPTYTPAGLILGTVYYWHVKARDAAGNWGDWSTDFSMNPQATLPSAPTLIGPSYTSIFNNTTPTFDWNAATNGAIYQLQVDNLSTFASPEVDVNIIGGLTYTLSGSESLTVDGRYYWHVRAQNITGGWGPWSISDYFTLDTTAPAAPTLTAPADGATPVGTPAFTWSIPTGANAYQFQIDDDSGFGSPLITTPDGDAFPGTPLAIYTYTPSGLTLGTVYYWHVRARDAAGNWGDWSTAFSMNPQATLPSAPVLIGPSYTSLFNDTNPTFYWNAATNGVIYQLQVDNVYSFTSPEVDVPNINDLTYTLTGAETLTTDGLYYWRVRAQNITGGWGPWSSALYFTLDTTAPAVPTLTSPANGTEIASIPTFTWSFTATATAYQFQFAYGTDYVSGLVTTPDGDVYPGTPITTTTFKPVSMQLNTGFYWHVRARDAAGNWSPWSEDRYIVILNTDTDGDSLPDVWETSGYDADNDQIIDVNLPALGASKLHKDIFVEMDYMVKPGVGDLGPNSTLMSYIVAVFNNAPVTNPDGITGVHIHLDKNQQVPYDSDLNPAWPDFDAIKSSYFDPKRTATHHYMIWADQYDGGTSSGYSRGIDASDFIVSLGSWPNGGTIYERLGTFIHELGHNLGLTHGGSDHENFKPNYLSIMNYSFQMYGIIKNGYWGDQGYPLNFDYQRINIVDLDESHLNEATGLQGADSIAGYGTLWHSDYDGYWWYTTNASVVHWYTDSSLETDVANDTNESGDYGYLVSQNNWQNISYSGGGVIGSGASLDKLQLMIQKSPPHMDELTYDQYLVMKNNTINSTTLQKKK